MAQEVEDVLTDLSIDKTKSGIIRLDGDFRRLNYMEFVAPLIGAIKELKARIEVLEGE